MFIQVAIFFSSQGAFSCCFIRHLRYEWVTLWQILYLLLMRQKFTLITLGVKDFQKALAFYEGLGWKKSEQSQEAYALFPLGGIVLGLYPLHELEKDTTLSHQQTSFSGMTISYNATSEEEVDAVMQEAERLGATVVKPAQKVFWGGYSGYFKDLDGYVFEVAYNPFWQFDSEGNLVM